MIAQDPNSYATNLVGNTLGQAPQPAPTLLSLVAATEELIKSLNSVHDRAHNLGQILGGSSSGSVGFAEQGGNTGGVIEQISDRIAHANRLSRQLSDAVDVIHRSVGIL